MSSTPDIIRQKLADIFNLDVNGYFDLISPHAIFTVNELMLINPNLTITLYHKPSILWSIRHCLD